MDNYLLDRQTLEQFVNDLIAQRFPGQVETPQITHLREVAIQTLDDRIGTAIFGNLTQSQLAEVNQLLDTTDDPAAFQQFFQKVGIDLEVTIAKAMRKFSDEFLGGQNA